MRITLAEPVSPDFSKQLSQALALHLIQPKVFYDSATGLPSDDRTIESIVDAIEKQTKHSESVKGFIFSNYPQNVIQAQSLDMALARIGQPVSSAILVESTKKPQNRENRALIRYYRTQNKLILVDEADSIDEISSKIRLIYEKRRSSTKHLSLNT